MLMVVGGGGRGGAARELSRPMLMVGVEDIVSTRMVDAGEIHSTLTSVFTRRGGALEGEIR